MVALSTGLSGCANSTAPTSSPSTSTHTTPVAAVSPTTRFPLTCEQALPLSLVSSTMATTVSSAPATGFASYSAPMDRSLEQLGGLDCQWNFPNPVNAPPESYPPVAARLKIMPDADQQWNRFAAGQSVANGSDASFGDSSVGPTCAGPGDVDTYLVLCELNYREHGYWVWVSLFGVGGDSPVPTSAEAKPIAEKVFDEVTHAVAALPAPSPAWTAPHPASLPSSCAGWVSGTALGSTLGVNTAAVLESRVGPPSQLDMQAIASVGAIQCAGGGEAAVFVSALPGGGWAYDREIPALIQAGRAQAASVSGLGPDDAAALSCAPQRDCILDLRTGGNWLRLTLPYLDPAYNGPDSDLPTDPGRSNILAAGALFVTR